MRFLKIPENGASWNAALCYTMATERGLKDDMVVEVIDAISGEVLGTRRLYGITTAEIDIAPYVRNAIGVATLTTAILELSPSARAIIVRANGVDAEQRIFYRAKLHTTSPHILSSLKQPSVVAHGDVIRITAFATEEVRVSVEDKRIVEAEVVSAIQSKGMPVEIAVQTSLYVGHNVPIRVKVTCDRGYTYTFDCTIVEPTEASYRIAWYNTEGGIECYTFPRGVRESLGAEMAAEIRGRASRLRGVVARYRLVSAFEARDEVERIAGVIFSPEVYECKGVESSVVKLLDREIRYDDHGGLRRVELGVEKEWTVGL